MSILSSSQRAGHIAILDSLRGFAALGVVLCHFGGLGFLASDVLTAVFKYGLYGIHVFFVVSGFVIPWSLYQSGYRLSSLPRFIARRSIRIDPPYYLAVLIVVLQHYVVTLWPSYGGARFDFEPLRILLHFVYAIPFSNYRYFDLVFWTLAIEFQYYLWIGITFGFLLSRRRLVVFVYLGLMLLSFYLPGVASHDTVFQFSAPFVLGKVAFLLHARRIERWTARIAGMCVMAVCWPQLGAPAAIASALAFLAICELQYTSRVTAFLGRISYSLYLTHNIIRLPLFVALRRVVGEVGLPAQLAYLVFMVAASIAFAYLFYRFVEGPTLRLSKRLREPPRVPVHTFEAAVPATSPSRP